MNVSFRFGPQIASAANVVAYVKKKSSQSLGGRHYQIEGRGAAGSVTKKALTMDNRHGVRAPFTVIFRKNVTGLIFALNWIVAEAEAERAGQERLGNGGRKATFFLLGDGATSGKQKFRSAKKHLPDFLDLYNGETTLDVDRWKGRGNLTYEAVVKEIADEELGDYYLTLGLIAHYGNDVMSKVHEFERRVLSCPSEAEADIVLTTVHQAKGLEWDRVQVLDDFVSLAKAVKPAKVGGRGITSFLLPKGDDEVNLMYVKGRGGGSLDANGQGSLALDLSDPLRSPPLFFQVYCHDATKA